MLISAVYDTIYLEFHDILLIHSVPAPVVTITLSHTPPLYAGISLTLTCAMTLDTYLDSGESIETKWSGFQNIQHGRLSGARSISSTHTAVSATISPLAHQDTGTYTCTGSVTSVVQQATASYDITIYVNSELSSR